MLITSACFVALRPSVLRTLKAQHGKPQAVQENDRWQARINSIRVGIGWCRDDVLDSQRSSSRVNIDKRHSERDDGSCRGKSREKEGTAKKQKAGRGAKGE